MLKYTEAIVGFSEVPEEITLCINISNCPIHCKGCHSPHLWQDIGTELKPVVLSDLIAKNQGITCVAFMGGDSNPQEVVNLASWVKNNTELKVCWYSGRDTIGAEIQPKLHYFIDYLKLGPYVEELGGLDSPTTNQRFFEVKQGTNGTSLKDITFKFRNNETDNKNKSAD